MKKFDQLRKQARVVHRRMNEEIALVDVAMLRKHQTPKRDSVVDAPDYLQWKYANKLLFGFGSDEQTFVIICQQEFDDRSEPFIGLIESRVAVPRLQSPPA